MYTPTEQEIKEAKKKHVRVLLLEFPEIGMACMLAKPSRQVVALAFTKAQTDPLGMSQVIRDNCWIAGDEDLRTNDDYLVSMNTKIDKLIGITTAELKEL